MADLDLIPDDYRQLLRLRVMFRYFVVLLVVLSLLVLFVLVAVTYAVVAGHFKRAALAASRSEIWGDDPFKYTDRAAYQRPVENRSLDHLLRSPSST